MDSQLDKAEKVLNGSMAVFKKREDYLRVIECQLLLFQFLVKKRKLSTYDEIENYYKKHVEEQVKTLGFELRGLLVAESLERTSKYLWDKYES